MTGKQRLIVGVICGAALLGGAAWANGQAAGTAHVDAAEVAATGGAGAGVDALIEAARLAPLMRIIATEGARHGLGLERSLFPGRGGEAWADAVADIQAPDRLTGMLTQAIEEELQGPDMEEALAFYRSALGRKVAEREVASRRAMLDAATEAAALRASSAARDGGRAALVAELIGALDLVSANVSGGLNANLAFYRGLGDGGALASRLTEREMLSMVGGQEAEIRAATRRWLRAHLTLAYAPLSDRELRDYIAFSSSDAGRRLSAAVFAGFGKVFEATSYELGLAAARFLAMEDA